MRTRTQIRDLVKEFSTPSGPLLPTILFFVDILGWLGCLALVATVSSWEVKVLAGLAMGIWGARLFILGHDACHAGFSAHKAVNSWVGRISFLPTLTTFSLWAVGHNVVHHGFTNFAPLDNAWAPLSPVQYAEKSSLQKLLYRAYRSGYFPGLHFMLHVWWAGLFFPNKKAMPSPRPVFRHDSWLVLIFAVAWIGALGAAAAHTQQSFLGLTLVGAVLPFYLSHTILGFITYVHHTRPEIPWFDDKALWAQAQSFLRGTADVKFPRWANFLGHNIMEHNAHHVDMRIPFGKLPEAQEKLLGCTAELVHTSEFSWSAYFEIARTCKLYDFKKGCWVPFPKNPT
jgi:acyl-lipid omega-6 desaturase (Delta-12 desaturase)